MPFAVNSLCNDTLRDRLDPVGGRLARQLVDVTAWLAGPASAPRVEVSMETVGTNGNQMWKLHTDPRKPWKPWNPQKRKRRSFFLFIESSGFHGFRGSVCSFHIWFPTVSTVLIHPARGLWHAGPAKQATRARWLGIHDRREPG